jgi:hypothetical protein
VAVPLWLLALLVVLACVGASALTGAREAAPPVVAEAAPAAAASKPAETVAAPEPTTKRAGRRRFGWW